jgi:hypothetical protein
MVEMGWRFVNGKCAGTGGVRRDLLSALSEEKKS